MNQKWIWKFKVLCLFFLCFACLAKLSTAAYEEDPLKATQTNAVPVTEELLTREGQPGPASPTFKMSDTARFLVKKPYQTAEKGKDVDQPRDESSSDLWDNWLFWEEDNEDNSILQTVDTK